VDDYDKMIDLRRKMGLKRGNMVVNKRGEVVGCSDGDESPVKVCNQLMLLISNLIIETT